MADTSNIVHHEKTYNAFVTGIKLGIIGVTLVLAGLALFVLS